MYIYVDEFFFFLIKIDKKYWMYIVIRVFLIFDFCEVLCNV